MRTARMAIAAVSLSLVAACGDNDTIDHRLPGELTVQLQKPAEDASFQAALAASGNHMAVRTSSGIVVYERSADGQWGVEQTIRFNFEPEPLTNRGTLDLDNGVLAFIDGPQIRIHTHQEGTWTQTEVLSANGPLNLALDNRTLAIRTRRSVDVHEIENGVWTGSTANLGVPGNAAPPMQALAVSGDRIAVSSAKTVDYNHWSVVVFTREGESWTLENEIEVGESQNEYLGWSVALESDILVIGTYSQAGPYAFHLAGNDGMPPRTALEPGVASSHVTIRDGLIAVPDGTGVNLLDDRGDDFTFVDKLELLGDGAYRPVTMARSDVAYFVVADSGDERVIQVYETQ